MLRMIRTRSRLAIAGGGACLILAATAFGALSTGSAVAKGKCLKVALEFKLQGLAVFTANTQGANMVAAKYGICHPQAYGGPATASATGQVTDVQADVKAGYKVIAFTSDDPTVPAPALQAAMKAGVKVITFDSDVPSARTVFIQDTAYNTIGQSLIDAAVKFAGATSTIGIMSSTPTATIQLAWIGAMKAYVAKKYPQLNGGSFGNIIGYGQSDPAISLTQATAMIHANPTLKAIIPIDSAAIVGTAGAITNTGNAGKIGDFGIGPPKEAAQYFQNGSMQGLFLWNELGQGMLIDCMAAGIVAGTIKAGSTFTCPYGPKGSYVNGPAKWTWVTKPNAVTGATKNTVIFSKPLEFTPSNYTQYNF